MNLVCMNLLVWSEWAGVTAIDDRIAKRNGSPRVEEIHQCVISELDCVVPASDFSAGQLTQTANHRAQYCVW